MSDEHAELDTATHMRNVFAFMQGTYRISGLADQTYLDMIAEDMDGTVLLGLYPYDVTTIAAVWARSSKRWFARRNRWDEFTHRRTLNRFADAVIDLQRYFPSLWVHALDRHAGDNDGFLGSLQLLEESLTHQFVMPGTNRMNGNVNHLLLDVFHSAAFVSTGRTLNSVVTRAVKKNSKTTSNVGFEDALTNFFKALNRLLDLPGSF